MVQTLEVMTTRATLLRCNRSQELDVVERLVILATMTASSTRCTGSHALGISEISVPNDTCVAWQKLEKRELRSL